MKLRKLTLTAVLTAAALVMFVLESQLPPLTAIPGIKPGLSNIFTLFAMQALGPGWALGVLLVRVTLGCVITGQGMALLYSLTGGIFAYIGMLALRRWFSGRRLWILSVFCAMAHNFGQLCAAALIARTRAVWYYLPVLLPAAILAGRKGAKAENRPGVTRGKQWITVDQGLLLLDTPGILWPKFEDPEAGMRLAYTGAVKEDVVDTETLACHFIALLAKFYPQTLSERYKLEAPEDADGYELLQLAGRKRGYLVSGGEVNTERMAKALMDDYRSGKLGKLTLESPEEQNA